MAAPEEGSFADLLAGSDSGPRRRWQVGEKVAAKIIQLGQDVAFLELGSGVAEGMIDVAELLGPDGEVTARVGDIVDGVVVKGGERGVVVSRGHATRGHHDREALVEASRTGLPVEGVVKAVNKGGLEVEVHGQRAFCPISQVDLHFVADPAAFVGQRLQFKVQRADGRDAVLSRRALLEEERAERARKTRETLAEGAVFDGVVTSVQDYGAFVDIGGVEGLVHVSELAWDRSSRPGDLLKAGDAVKVQVLRVEQDAKKGERIGLSVRSLTPRPEPVAPAPGTRPAAPPAARRARPSPPRRRRPGWATWSRPPSTRWSRSASSSASPAAAAWSRGARPARRAAATCAGPSSRATSWSARSSPSTSRAATGSPTPRRRRRSSAGRRRST